MADRAIAAGGAAAGSSPPLHVVIAGGGVAASELLLATHALARHRVRMTLVTPTTHLDLFALHAVTAFAGSPPPIALADVAARGEATWVHAALRRVLPRAHRVLLDNRHDLHYDALAVAVGAHAVSPYNHGVITFGREYTSHSIDAVLADACDGYIGSVAFVVPPAAAWPLPLYELALGFARTLRRRRAHADLHLVTPEPSPLAVFGPAASAATGRALTALGVELHPGSIATVERRGRIRMIPGGRVLEVDDIIALPRLRGPAVRGLPHDAAGFIPIDGHGEVPGLRGVFAIGDASTFPIKQGGVACQLADVVAQHLARMSGVGIEPERFRPVLRGQVVTGDTVLALTQGLRREPGLSRASVQSMWVPAAKVAGRHLSALLESEPGWAPRTVGEPPVGGVDVAIGQAGQPQS